jgi:hypothetical protein
VTGTPHGQGLLFVPEQRAIEENDRPLLSETFAAVEWIGDTTHVE